MGFLSSTKKATGYIFNFRVGQWLDYDSLKGTALYLYYLFRGLYRINPYQFSESYEEAKERLNLSDEYLNFQSKRYLWLSYFFLGCSLLFFSYMLFLGIKHHWMGTFMTLSLSLYALSIAFRYHFWRYQLIRQKLGCSVQEWWRDLFHKEIKHKGTQREIL